MASTFTAIQTITTTTNPSSVTFTGIPQTYKHLCIIGNVKCTDSNSYRMFFNSSTSSVYKWAEINMSGTSTPRNYRGFPSSFPLGNTEVWTNYFSAQEIWIPNYTSSVFSKSYLYRCTAMNGASLGSNVSNYGGGQWDTTSAITSIQFSPLSGTFMNDSNITLYGLI